MGLETHPHTHPHTNVYPLKTVTVLTKVCLEMRGKQSVRLMTDNRKLQDISCIYILLWNHTAQPLGGNDNKWEAFWANFRNNYD